MTDTTKYGPQTAEVEALLERVRLLTDADIQALKVAAITAWITAWYKAWHTMHRAVRDSVWDSVWAAIDEVWKTSRQQHLAHIALLALVVRDLITPDGFTQADYDLLTGPWRRVIGKIHPDDEEMSDD